MGYNLEMLKVFPFGCQVSIALDRKACASELLD